MRFASLTTQSGGDPADFNKPFACGEKASVAFCG